MASLQLLSSSLSLSISLPPTSSCCQTSLLTQATSTKQLTVKSLSITNNAIHKSNIYNVIQNKSFFRLNSTTKRILKVRASPTPKHQHKQNFTISQISVLNSICHLNS